jgi:transposase
MRYYTRVEVSLRSVPICVVDDSGAIKFESEIAAKVGAIVGALRNFSPEIDQIGFEAGTLTPYLTYGVRAAGAKHLHARPCKEA